MDRNSCIRIAVTIILGVICMAIPLVTFIYMLTVVISFKSGITLGNVAAGVVTLIAYEVFKDIFIITRDTVIDLKENR